MIRNLPLLSFGSRSFERRLEMKKSGDIVAHQDEALKTLYAMLAGPLPKIEQKDMSFFGMHRVHEANDSREKLSYLVQEVLGGRYGVRLQRYQFDTIVFLDAIFSGARRISVNFWIKFDVYNEPFQVKFELDGAEGMGLKRWSVVRIIFRLSEDQRKALGDFPIVFQIG